MVDALKAGAQVFKSFSQESGMTLDNVEKIMMDVEEVCKVSKSKEIVFFIIFMVYLPPHLFRKIFHNVFRGLFLCLKLSFVFLES